MTGSIRVWICIGPFMCSLCFIQILILLCGIGECEFKFKIKTTTTTATTTVAATTKHQWLMEVQESEYGLMFVIEEHSLSK